MANSIVCMSSHGVIRQIVIISVTWQVHTPSLPSQRCEHRERAAGHNSNEGQIDMQRLTLCYSGTYGRDGVPHFLCDRECLGCRSWAEPSEIGRAHV